MLWNFLHPWKHWFTPREAASLFHSICNTYGHVCILDMSFWSWKCTELCKMNFKSFRNELFNSAHNEWSLSECSNHSYHSVPFCHPTFSGTGSPSKHLKDFINLEKQIKLFKKLQSSSVPICGIGNFACSINYLFWNSILQNVLLSACTREVAL